MAGAALRVPGCRVLGASEARRGGSLSCRMCPTAELLQLQERAISVEVSVRK